MSKRFISEIAFDIGVDLSRILDEGVTTKKPRPNIENSKFCHVVPYLKAMLHLNTIRDKYLCDSAEEIIIRFLSNASVWRGDVARRLKEELKELL